MSDTPKSILAELALHLSHDAGVNGSKFTDRPMGRLSLADSPDALWRRVRDVQQDGSLEQEILTELVKELNTNAESMGNPPCRVGSLSLQTSDGLLWKRTLDVLGYEPDMIRDVVAPAIKARLAK
jgi:hypothetical protein